MPELRRESFFKEVLPSETHFSLGSAGSGFSLALCTFRRLNVEGKAACFCSPRCSDVSGKGGGGSTHIVALEREREREGEVRGAPLDEAPCFPFQNKLACFVHVKHLIQDE